MAELHRDLALYRRAVVAARDARGSRARPSGDELTAAHDALHGESVTLTEEAVPLQRRGLLGPTSEVTRTSADALLARMTAAFDAATRVVADVAAVWDAVAAQLGPADRALDALRAEAAALPEATAEVARWSDRLEALRAAALTDPLAHAGTAAPVPAAPLAEIDAGVAAAREELREARALRAGLDERVAALTGRVDALVTVESAAEAVAAEGPEPRGRGARAADAPAARPGAARGAPGRPRRGARRPLGRGVRRVRRGVGGPRHRDGAGGGGQAVLGGLSTGARTAGPPRGAARQGGGARAQRGPRARRAAHPRAGPALERPVRPRGGHGRGPAYQRGLEEGT